VTTTAATIYSHRVVSGELKRQFRDIVMIVLNEGGTGYEWARNTEKGGNRRTPSAGTVPPYYTSRGQPPISLMGRKKFFQPSRQICREGANYRSWAIY